MINQLENTPIEEDFNQVLIWPGTHLEGRIESFVQFVKEEFDARIQYLETYETSPVRSFNGSPIEWTGGRQDIVFALHKEDLGKFTLKWRSHGVQEIEFIMNDDVDEVYPDRFRKYTFLNDFND